MKSKTAPTIIMTRSIRTVVVDAVGLLRSVEPASNISMMTIGEPQQGQGWIGLSIASVPAGA